MRRWPMSSSRPGATDFKLSPSIPLTPTSLTKTILASGALKIVSLSNRPLTKVEPSSKKAFYKAVADAFHARLRLRPEDVFINLIEVPKRELVLREWDRPICGVAGQLV